ncbi:MAG: fluoride efflux transporter CrcB [Xanthomonadales bacterium]|nr:fluoride efflux transporter CrcB [Xanthomonadales bacterium]
MEFSTLLWVSAGSAIGGAGRYVGSGLVARMFGETFPWGTLLVNVLGSFLIGVIATLVAPEGRLLLGPTARQFLMLGVLGGFTTFSSFSLQTLNLVQEGEWLHAGGYVLGSVALCLVGVWLGHALGVVINR